VNGTPYGFFSSSRGLRVRLGLRFQKMRFQNSDFKMCDLKKVIFKNAVKRLGKSQFGF